MPHAVLRGEVDLAGIATSFEPETLRVGSDVGKTLAVFLEPGDRALLIDCLVVEAGRKQPFYVKISSHDRGTFTLRIDPMTHPDRTPGVRALVTHLARSLLEGVPGASVESTNLVLSSDRSVAP